MSAVDGLIDNPAAIEPLLPGSDREALAGLSCDIMRKAGFLAGQIPARTVRVRAAKLVREMNSYYSNLIEGHKTLPRDIERALRQDFSDNPEQRANQQLNKAHVETEQVMLERLEAEPDLAIHSGEFISWLHREFYQRLPPELHWSTDRHGKAYPIEAGVWRTFEVTVGRHRPPRHQGLPQMIRRFEEGYGGRDLQPTDQLVALAAGHHRLVWIHPFGDGNGRVTRLHSRAWLARAKVDSGGLWTLARGLARDRDRYYQHLNLADQRRWNDLDGRGNLSDKALGSFCLFMLRTILDQIEFMTELFEFQPHRSLPPEGTTRPQGTRSRTPFEAAPRGINRGRGGAWTGRGDPGSEPQRRSIGRRPGPQGRTARLPERTGPAFLGLLRQDP